METRQLFELADAALADCVSFGQAPCFVDRKAYCRRVADFFERWLA